MCEPGVQGMYPLPLEASMVNLTLRFVNCCRAADLRVSTAEVLDVVRQLAIVDPFDEFQFYTVLRTNFAKSHRDQDRFDRLYNLFFHEMQNDLTGAEVTPESQGFDEVVARLAEEMEADGDAMRQAILDFMAGKPLDYLDLINKLHTQEEQASTGLKSNMTQLSSRLEVMLKINQMKEKVLQFLGGNHAVVDDSVRASIEEEFTRRLESAYDILTKEPKTKNSGLKTVAHNEEHYDEIGQVPFSSLSDDEIEEVRDVIRQLVKKLEEIATLRYSVAKKGEIDVKKTLRRAGKYLGIPIEIIRKDKPLRKGKIVVLCDVSGSVWSTARFMLNILYALQECFSKVKSFIFVSELAEVTDHFIEKEVNDAIEAIMKDAPINYYAQTDYGMAFQTFKNDHLQDLDKKTTLIIIGDARSNYQNPQDHILRQLRDKCRRIIWLNPEQEKQWTEGDSEMYTYKAHCHEVRACGNLNQLVDFIQELVL
ncbi:von willebrand factor type a [Desulfoluna butyratoxydans]|uniref:von willebrand factor type a n=2 Tax=Desulfoluna butyratoxydans TaxID=231438 RepID=A0A4U8YGM9_9BACT|nr:von willebrand factor type a [Desulfoluna butyratoxydans]